MKRHGFTLIEILVVIAIIALLAAIIFPVFSLARERGRSAACQSNLKQLGAAMAMYIGDNERYPHAIDPADKHSNIWKNQVLAQGVILGNLPLLSDDNALGPYIKSSNVWKCPSDTGFDHLEDKDRNEGLGDNADWRLEGKTTYPSCFEKYGMSYFYRTELMFRNLSDDFLRNPAQTNVLFDGDGSWHGTGVDRDERRYNCLYADGHVKNVDYDGLQAAWKTPAQ